jgi:hypothetical protein
LLTEKEAEAKANQLIAASMTPELIRYLAIQKWKGDVQMYSSAQAPIPFMALPDMSRQMPDGKPSTQGKPSKLAP